MRNLKRALSLALAAVMVIGMMVVGAGAASYNDFTDKDEIKNSDAVAMVSELGIINGLPNGTFGPTQNIDRASFVKMLCLAYNGGNEPILPANNKVSYVDTAGTWAAQYIEYCTNLNFVAGDGTTGKFNPTNPVTVSQAAKMLLTALGYSATTEGYVGYDWQMNVDTAANTNKLYKGLTNTNTSSNLTRDDAAQMIYNALNASMVKYEGVWDPSANTIKPQLAKTGKTMLEEKFGAIKVEGVVVGNEYAALTGSVQDAGKTNMKFEAVKDGDSTVLEQGSFKVASTPDMLGKTVTMYVKPGSSKDASKATVLGALIVSGDNKVVTLTESKTTAAKIDSFLDDENLTIEDTTRYYVNYKLQSHDSGATTIYDLPASNEAGKIMTFIDNDNDGEVEYILQTVKTFGQVTSYVSSGKGAIYVNSINASTTSATDGVIDFLDNDNAAKKVTGFEDVKQDDYVFFYKFGNTYYVEKAEYVDVTVSSVKGDKVTGDGKTYEQSGLVSAVNGSDSLSTVGRAALGDEIRLYLDASGYVVRTDDVDTTVDYLYVLDVDSYFSSVGGYATTEVLLPDGTTAVVKAYVDGATKHGATKNNAYAYSVKSDGTYKLTTVTTGASSSTNYQLVNTGLTTDANGGLIKKGNANLGSVIANGKTVFVIQRGTTGNFSVYTGIANVPNVDHITKYSIVANKDDVAKIVFVETGSLSGSKDGIYLLNKNPEVTKDKDNETYTYDVIYKGEKTSLTSDTFIREFDTNGKGYYANVDINNSEITNVTVSAAADFVQAAPAQKAADDIVRVNNVTYSINSKTVFLVVDGSDVKPASINSIIIDPIAQSATHDSRTSNIVVVPDSDNTGIAAYVFICK